MPGIIDELIDAFTVLPGVGNKTAQRMAYHLLDKKREGGTRLSAALEQAMTHVGHCKKCRNFTENDVCDYCSSPKRSDALLCVVETPADIRAIASAADFNGRFFVLMGHLSPLDGIGPEQLGLGLLEERLKSGEVEEVILATNPTMEGEATAHFISQMAKNAGLRVTRIAHGVPLGGELEYIDGGTLSHAIAGRQEI